MDHDLQKKISASKEFSAEDKELMEYLVISITKSKEHLNYLFIFISSALAIVVDIMLEQML